MNISNFIFRFVDLSFILCYRSSADHNWWPPRGNNLGPVCWNGYVKFPFSLRSLGLQAQLWATLQCLQQSCLSPRHEASQHGIWPVNYVSVKHRYFVVSLAVVFTLYAWHRHHNVSLTD